MTLLAQDITVAAGGRLIVDHASITVRPGEIVGLIGPNGAGKSTLLRALLGLRPRVGGEVSLGGALFETIEPRERARRVAYLPQDRRLEWGLTVEDVVMLGRFPHQPGFGGPSPADREAVARALERVGAAGLRGRPASVLSAGERALVLLARALAVEAPLLLADEPIAALDPYHQLHVMDVLEGEARRGAGVLVVIHDLALAARFTDRVVLMNEGAVVAEGTPAAVLTPERVSEVYRVSTIGGAEGERSWVIPWERLADVCPEDERA